MSEDPTPRLRRFFVGYWLLWTLGLPFAMFYLMWRGRKDPLYRHHIAERFGWYISPVKNAIWVHAVSLGELRSAVPLIHRFVKDGDAVVITCFTPAGRREATTIFADDIASGQVRVVWVPLEFHWCYRRFFRAFTPRLGLVMEIEIWPVMNNAARRAGVPLYPCNAQYPLKSFTRDQDKSRWRFDLIGGYAGAFVKSDLQKDRFAATGLAPIYVTGELRFDQPIPPALVTAGTALKAQTKRRVITITSVVAGEDATYIAAIKALRGPDAPLVVYVPRAPERFDESHALLTDAGLNVARRTSDLEADLSGSLPQCDVLLGDSMGEMYAYLALCDVAIIGGSFVPKGAHNISEPLALGKPVVLGPHTWTIEFPLVEARAAGVATQVPDVAALVRHLNKANADASPDQVATFFETQSGAVDRTYKAIRAEMSR